MIFIIISQARTGSTMISKTINMHPDIKCHGEVFNIRNKVYYKQLSKAAVKTRFTKSFLDGLFYSGRRFAAMGMKIMWPAHLTYPHDTGDDIGLGRWLNDNLYGKKNKRNKYTAKPG